MEGREMSGKALTLLVILAFVAFSVGSFIWFIATWDKSREEPVSIRSNILEERRA
jgi:hypothetical protein